MHRVWIVCLFLLLFAVPCYGEIVIQHTGATDPTTEGWTNVGRGGNPSADGESWHFATDAVAHYAANPELESFEDDWSVSFTMKYNAGPIKQTTFNVWDGTGRGYGFSWDPSGAHHYVAGQLTLISIPDFDPYAWHDYAVEFEQATLIADVFVDGSFVTDIDEAQKNSPPPGTTVVMWGDSGTTAGFSDSQWKSVIFDDGRLPSEPEPEPAIAGFGFNFGSLGRDESSPIKAFDIWNNADSLLGVDLDLLSIEIAGADAAFITDLAPFEDLAAGDFNSFTTWMDTSTPGDFSGIYTLNFSDELGNDQVLTLNLAGSVVPEPATWAMLGMLVAVWLLFRWLNYMRQS